MLLRQSITTIKFLGSTISVRTVFQLRAASFSIAQAQLSRIIAQEHVVLQSLLFSHSFSDKLAAAAQAKPPGLKISPSQLRGAALMDIQEPALEAAGVLTAMQQQ